MSHALAESRWLSAAQIVEKLISQFVRVQLQLHGGKKNTTQKKEKKEKHSEKKRGKAAPDKSDGRFYTSEKL